MWQGTLNFSEAQIQGPQGWDLLLSWVFDRVRLKKLVSNKLGGGSKNKRMPGGNTVGRHV